MDYPQNIKISVLIPVYGVEKYIEKCVRSLCNQTMKEGIEFIFIDDSTQDNSIEIIKKTLEDYKERKPQVRIIRHETNQGLAEARVTGVKNALGEYVIHCDSDDWVEPDMYESLYNKAKETNADIVGCDYWLELSDKKLYRQQNFSLSQNRIIQELLKLKGQVRGYLWNRLVKREFYNEDIFRAHKGVTFLEDLAVTFPMHIAAKKVAYVSKPLYHYNKQNVDSITSELNKKSLNSGIRVFSELLNLSISKDLKKRINKRRNNLYLYYIDNYHQFNPNLFREEYAGMIPSSIVKKFTGGDKFRYKMVMKRQDLIAKTSLFIEAVFQIISLKIKKSFSI